MGSPFSWQLPESGDVTTSNNPGSLPTTQTRHLRRGRLKIKSMQVWRGLLPNLLTVSDDLSCSADESLISTVNGIVHPETAAEACLAPTLALFGWAGEGRRIREALPHFDRIENIEALRRVLSLLGYGTTRKFLRQSDIKPDCMPCLLYARRRGRHVDCRPRARRNPACIRRQLRLLEKNRTYGTKWLVILYLGPSSQR